MNGAINLDHLSEKDPNDDTKSRENGVVTKHFALCVVASVLLHGCGVAAKVNARNDMEKSKAEYKECLHQHLQDVSACEGLRVAYEADIKAYRATSAAILPGSNRTIKVNSSTDE